MTPLVFSAQMKCRHWADSSQGDFPVLWASALKKRKTVNAMQIRIYESSQVFFLVLFFLLSPGVMASGHCCHKHHKLTFWYVWFWSFEREGDSVAFALRGDRSVMRRSLR